MKVANTLNHVQIAIQREAGKNSVDQRPETSGPTAGLPRAGAQRFRQPEASESGDCFADCFRHWVTVRTATEL